MKASPILPVALAAALALAPLASPSLAAKRERADRAASRDPSGAADPSASPGAAAPGAATPPAGVRHDEASPPSTLPGPDEETDRPPAPPVRVQALGEGTERLHLVDHGEGVWSMHAESLGTYVLFRLWKEVGGPEVIAKDPVDHPYTLSLHRVKAEEIVSRLLAGHGYTLHYDGKGRLSQVRVYSAEAGHVYRTPRLTESLGAWRDVETGADSSGATR